MQIEKKMKIYHNVKMFDTELARKYFTTHGQHLNSSGKELISNKLSIVIKDMFVKKQPTPICMPWKELSQLTDLNHNNPVKLPMNTKTSKQPQNSDVGVLNTEFSDQKNLKELPASLNPSKRQRKEVALRNRFFMDLDNRHNPNKNYTDKSTVYIKIFHQNIRGLRMKSSELIGHLHRDYPHALCLTEHHLKHFQIKTL